MAADALRVKGFATIDGGVASRTVAVTRTAGLGGLVTLVCQVVMAIGAGDAYVLAVHGVIKRSVCAEGAPQSLVSLPVTGAAGSGLGGGGSDRCMVTAVAGQAPFLDVTGMLEEDRPAGGVEHDTGRGFGSVFRGDGVAGECGYQADSREEVGEVRLNLEAHGRANRSERALLVDRMGPMKGKRKLKTALSPL